MIFIYEIPIIFIILLLLGVLGMDLFPLIRTLVFIIGIISIFFGACFAFGGDDEEEKVKGIVTIVFNIVLIIVFIALDGNGASFSLYDIIFK